MMQKNYTVVLIFVIRRLLLAMTINGPAPMLLAFFMNAAIDQQCEKYIKELRIRKRILKKISEEKYKGSAGNRYITIHHAPGSLPEGNNGLGLKLLGLSGDEVLPKEIYEQ